LAYEVGSVKLRATTENAVQIIIDGEENDSKRFLIVKVVCQKCGESEEVLRFGFEEVFEEVNP